MFVKSPNFGDLSGWAAKALAHFAVQAQDSWINRSKTDAIKLLKGAAEAASSANTPGQVFEAG